MVKETAPLSDSHYLPLHPLRPGEGSQCALSCQEGDYNILFYKKLPSLLSLLPISPSPSVSLSRRPLLLCFSETPSLPDLAGTSGDSCIN